MNTGKTLFAQLMEFLPWKTFSRIGFIRTFGAAGWMRPRGSPYESAVFLEV